MAANAVNRRLPVPPHLSQRGQQPLCVVQGGPAVGQTVRHVSQLLPHGGKSDLDVAQACPVQLAPALQVVEHRQRLAVQLLKDPGRAAVKPLPGKNLECLLRGLGKGNSGDHDGNNGNYPYLKSSNETSSFACVHNNNSNIPPVSSKHTRLHFRFLVIDFSRLSVSKSD